MMPDFWVYILLCANHSYYTGYTINLIQRCNAHFKGTGAKYTRSFKPLLLVGVWPIYGTKQQAMQIERFIKQMDRKTKQELIENPLILEQYYCES